MSSAPLFAKARRALKQGDFAAYEAGFLAALEADPLNLEGWLELGEGYLKAGKPQGALMAAQAASQGQPNNPKPYLLMARIFEAAGDASKTLAALDKADQLAPSQDTALLLGQKYLSLDLPGRSVPYWQRLSVAEPLNKTYRQQYALSMMLSGKVREAAPIFQDMLLADPGNKQLGLHYGMAMQSQNFATPDERGLQAMLLLLEQEDYGHQLLSIPAASLLDVMPQYQLLQEDANTIAADDPRLADMLNDRFFLQCILRLRVRSEKLEHWLTALRRRFLLEWDEHAITDSAQDFLAALAVAMFYTEYVFATTQEEDVAIAKGQGSFALRGCYQPLTDEMEIPASDSRFFDALITAHMTYPRRERELVQTIESFAGIADKTSADVKAMYEARPYPRWRQAIQMRDKPLLGQTGKNMDVLIAGCGTGQEIMQFVANLSDVKVTAIDLSFASMAYAKRQCERYNLLKRVTFAQGDLQDAPLLERQFDVVSSSGVLHHLAKPERGLQALLQVLKEGGRMHMALYAQHARHYYLQAAIDMAAAKNIGQNADGIRAFRQEIMALPEDHPARRPTKLGDFYTLNECTDLLFHIQECWYTLPQLKALLDANGLELLAMRLKGARRIAYLQANPADRAHKDWAALEAYEAESAPDTFIGMYDFWVKRVNDKTAHPLDTIIARHML